MPDVQLLGCPAHVKQYSTRTLPRLDCYARMSSLPLPKATHLSVRRRSEHSCLRRECPSGDSAEIQRLKVRYQASGQCSSNRASRTVRQHTSTWSPLNSAQFSTLSPYFDQLAQMMDIGRRLPIKFHGLPNSIISYIIAFLGTRLCTLILCYLKAGSYSTPRHILSGMQSHQALSSLLS